MGSAVVGLFIVFFASIEMIETYILTHERECDASYPKDFSIFSPWSSKGTKGCDSSG
jgi:hypothetical protein